MIFFLLLIFRMGMVVVLVGHMGVVVVAGMGVVELALGQPS